MSRLTEAVTAAPTSNPVFFRLDWDGKGERPERLGEDLLASLLDLPWPDSVFSAMEPKLRFENILIALTAFIQAQAQKIKDEAYRARFLEAFSIKAI